MPNQFESLSNNDINQPLGTGNLDGNPESAMETQSGDSMSGTSYDDDGYPQSSEGSVDNTEQKNIDYQQRYKDIQSAYSKSTETVKNLKNELDSLNDFGGIENIKSWMSYLTEGEAKERFQQFIKNEQDIVKNNNAYREEPEYKEALSVVDERINQALNQKVQPYIAAQQEMMQKRAMEKMDSQYPNWRNVQKDMLQLTSKPEFKNIPPTFEGLEILYNQVVMKNQNLLDYEYKKRMSQRQSKSIMPPVNNRMNNVPSQAGSIREALIQAQQSSGVMLNDALKIN